VNTFTFEAFHDFVKSLLDLDAGDDAKIVIITLAGKACELVFTGNMIHVKKKKTIGPINDVDP
jgi:hypothetical protein